MENFSLFMRPPLPGIFPEIAISASYLVIYFATKSKIRQDFLLLSAKFFDIFSTPRQSGNPRSLRKKPLFFPAFPARIRANFFHKNTLFLFSQYMQTKWQFANFQCENCMIYFYTYEYVTVGCPNGSDDSRNFQGGENLCGQVTL